MYRSAHSVSDDWGLGSTRWQHLYVLPKAHHMEHKFGWQAVKKHIICYRLSGSCVLTCGLCLLQAVCAGQDGSRLAQGKLERGLGGGAG